VRFIAFSNLVVAGVGAAGASRAVQDFALDTKEYLARLVISPAELNADDFFFESAPFREGASSRVTR
jgi:hypothetical protein